MTRQTSALAAKSAFVLPRAVNHRKSYDERTGRGERAGKIIASAVCDMVAFTEDADGYLLRDWSSFQGRLTNDDFILAVKHRRAVEHEDLLEVISPGVIKYALAQKWLVKSQFAAYYLVTTIARDHHKLPLKDRDGRKIKFHEVA